jgi:DNA-binding NarL/FixJ family response regulator
MPEPPISAGQKITRIFIVDDHPWIRMGLSSLIRFNSELVLCGEADDAETALQAIPAAKPDIAILDISLKGNTDGIELTQIIRKQFPHIIVLVLSMHVESDWAERALAAGARGYMIKSDAADQLLDVVPRLIAGEIFLSEEIRGKVDPKYLRG